MQRLGDKMLLCYMEMLGRRVSGELDYLHPVQQRLGNRIPCVGGTDEKDMGEIVRQVHIVVFEGRVLLRIQRLQQCCGGIAVEA